MLSSVWLQQSTFQFQHFQQFKCVPNASKVIAIKAYTKWLDGDISDPKS